MANPALSYYGRAQRRMVLENEARRRKSGSWGDWQSRPVAHGEAGPGWAAEIHTAFKNEVFCVLERSRPDGVRHLMISSMSGNRPTWWEAQRIKNEIAGADATAVEVYPPQSEVVDDADAYHLWVLAAPFPHSLKTPAAQRKDHGRDE